MTFKSKLLATAALPLIAFAGMTPALAAGLPRPAVSADADGDVIRVQSDEDLLLQQQKQERRKNRQNQDAQSQDTQSDDQQQEQQPRRKKHQNAEAQQDMQQSDDQQQEQPRRKKHQQAQQDDGQQQMDQVQQQDNSEPVKPRRKKHQDAEQQMDQQSDQAQQSDQSEPVKPRRKRNQDAEQQMDQQSDQAQQSDQSEPVKPRRKKNKDAEQQMDQQSDQMQQSDQSEPVKPRRKKNQDAQQTDDQMQQTDDQNAQPRKKHKDNATAAESNNGEPSEDDIRKALENRKNKKHKNQDSADEQNSGDQQNADQQQMNGDNAATDDQPRRKKRQQPDTPEKVEQKKDIAADPAKSTDTIELPVKNGAAVLDSDKDADNKGGDKDRQRRKREREEAKDTPVPKSDKDAQVKIDVNINVKPVLQEKGERLTGFKGYDDLGGRRVGKDNDDRVIINIDGRVVVRGFDDNRISRRDDTRYDRLSDGRIREVVIRPDGDKIVTVRNRWGEIIRRTRIDGGGREYVIFFSPDLYEGRDRLFMRDPGDELPPMRLRIPVEDYIIDVSSDRNRDYEEFLDQPPVERVERVYSVDEVKYSARIRDKMRRIDLDTITFETGSAEIDTDQASSLKSVGKAIKDLLDKDPGETFLIEGHTDAVGSDESNLVLSDQRAESVANVLSDLFDIPPENLVTQGYGERYLKIDSDGPERANRRVTIRRITPLVRPVASNEE